MGYVSVQAVELVFLLLMLFVVAFGVLARKLKIPYPIVLVVAGTLLTGSVASEADLQRLGSVALLAAIPRFGHIGNKRLRSDLRTALALAAFGPDETTDVEGAAS